MVDAKSKTYANKVSKRWGKQNLIKRSFWQNRIIMSEFSRRISGSPDITPEQYFKNKYCRKPFKRAISFGCGNGRLECKMAKIGVCKHIVGIDISSERVERAKKLIAPELSDKVDIVCDNIEDLQSTEPVDLVVLKGILHHTDSLELLCEKISDMLEPNGLIYFDDFVGPTRMQWTDKQLAMINRLLSCLPEELRRDLTDPKGKTIKSRVKQQNVRSLIKSDPSEAIRSAQIMETLDKYFERVEVKPYGGAIIHQLFNRIMGNFEGHEEIIKLILEIELILMDEGIVDSDYVWAVYKPSNSKEPRRADKPKKFFWSTIRNYAEKF